MVNELLKLLVTLLVAVGISSCCSWEYDQKDFEFSSIELKHLGPYKTGGTIYFESNLGDIDTISIVQITENKDKGRKCFISTSPFNSRQIILKHLPSDKWARINFLGDGKKEIVYNSLVSISKSPLKRKTSYSINIKGFTGSIDSINKQNEYILNVKKIQNCFKIAHRHNERNTSPGDIEYVYWTDLIGLTAYSSKNGETWVVKK